jgi:prepilin signal peptidase PulO-like enzyme (type II secretory pathway)
MIGWLAGWLVNYLADVLPFTRRLSPPVCLECNEPLGWKKYLLFQPCQNGHSRKVRTWIVQALMLAASIYTWVNPPAKMAYILGFILIIYFGTIIVIDIEHHLILHPTSIAGAFLGLITGTVSHGISDTLWGGLGGFLIMMAFYAFGALFTHLRAKRMIAAGQEADDEEALGAGDVILATVLGLMLGWPLIWLSLLLGILLGGLFSLLIIVWLVVTGRYEKNALMLFIPYGPYLVTGAFLIIFFPKFIQMIVPG